jgi:hypothetical protein
MRSVRSEAPVLALGEIPRGTRTPSTTSWITPAASPRESTLSVPRVPGVQAKLDCYRQGGGLSFRAEPAREISAPGL